MNKRRKLLIAVSASALAAPLSAFAQQSRIFRIGILNVSDAASSNFRDEVFVQALRELGYTEGKNLFVDRRYADGDRGRLKGLAVEFVQSKVDAILANSSLKLSLN